MHILHTRGMPKNRFLNLATISLFIVCTAHLALLLASISLLNQNNEAAAVNLAPPFSGSKFNAALNLNRATNAIYVTANVIADSIFIFRCYAIWNFRRSIIIAPIILTFSGAVVGFIDSASPSTTEVSSFTFALSITLSLLTTFMLMILTAGRIWWLAREARVVMGQKITNRYYTVCAMILESGALYCAGGIAYIIISLRPANLNQIIATNGAILGQLVGIAPTIIAVRVGLGKSIESADSFVAMAAPRVMAPRGTRRPTVGSNEGLSWYIRRETDHDDSQAESV
ncbi:hypothetical protein DFH08DRAFT_309664 [Mycena albidolilacea]|uniref:Uncharacterized protein n=1 Tax=Mycena albidolilacea TaxID=1033008 RepID=A0AAD6ZPB1_9AGAR|nr:hypothetical protein DFH08DRAFT_309664 [Mycena albidolilacea]